MKQVLIVLALVAVFFSADFVQAEDKSNGCGLGWQITSKTSFLGTSTRQTTNIFVPPTFGMTTGTLGCAQHSIAKAEMPRVNYALTNYEAIKSEAAMGNGEFLSAFAEVMGCGGSENLFIEQTRKDYRELFPENGKGIEMYKGIKTMIKNDRELASNCQTA